MARDEKRLANIAENLMNAEFEKKLSEARESGAKRDFVSANFYLKQAGNIISELKGCRVDTKKYQTEIEDVKKLYRIN